MAVREALSPGWWAGPHSSFILFRTMNSPTWPLIVRPDNTYEVKIDNSQVESRLLGGDDWDFLPPRR